MENKSIEIIISAVDRASKTLQGISGKFADMAKSAEAGSAIITGSLLLAGKSMIQTASNLETSRQGFVTLLGSVEEADKALAQIKKDASTTPFTLPGLISANQLLTQVTKNSERSEKLLLNVGKALSASGKGQKELDQVIVNLQQIGNTAKLSEMDVRQFGFAGINILELLADYYGVTKEKAGDMVKDSKDAFKDLEKAFEKAGSEGGKFARAYIDQAGTMNQLASNFGDAIAIAGAEIITQSGAFDALKQVLTKVIEVINTATPLIVDFIKQVSTNMPSMVAVLGGLLGVLTPIAIAFAGLVAPAIAFMAVGALIGGLIGLIVEKMGGWDAVMAMLTEKWNNLVLLFTTYVSPTLQIVMSEITQLAEVVLPVLRQKFAETVADIQLKLQGLKELWDIVFPTIRRTLEFTFKAIKSIVETLWGATQLYIATGIALLTGDFDSAFKIWRAGWEDMMRGLHNIARNILDGIVGMFKGKLNEITGTINTFIRGINEISGGKVKIGTLPSFQHGGVVPGSFNDVVPALLHGGERVVSRNGVDANSGTMSGGGGSTVNVIIEGDVNSVDTLNQIVQAVKDAIGRDNELSQLGVAV